jgi:predicted nucleotidyltransferase
MVTENRIEEEVLHEIARRLVSEFAPRKIILYGSRANGTAREESDYDLLIVWRDENPPDARAATVRRALVDLGFPMDIAVVTPREFEQFRKWRVHIAAVADREGRILHAA